MYICIYIYTRVYVQLLAEICVRIGTVHASERLVSIANVGSTRGLRGSVEGSNEGCAGREGVGRGGASDCGFH